MKIYRYWVKKSFPLKIDSGEIQNTVICGKSNLSEEDALRNAEKTAVLIQTHIDRREHFDKSEMYEVPIREPLLEELAPGNVITRNRYGAEILNTETMIFADIDNTCFKKRYKPGIFGRMFGKKEESEAEYQNRLQTGVLNSIKPEWIANSHIRVYRTHSGYRVLFAGLKIKAGSPECTDLLRAMNTDPLYTTLCEKQQCCRARLTPKPSRIKQKSLMLKFPYDPEQVDQINCWADEYDQKSGKFAVCKLISTFGKTPDSEDLCIIEYHDKKCKAAERLPLA